MQWLNVHHILSPITRHALVVLESIDAVDLAFDTFACALLDGEVDTSGYPEYNAVVGGVAAHWDEATGDMICRAVVGWGGKGVRGDTDRIGSRLLGGILEQHPREPVRARAFEHRATGSGGRPGRPCLRFTAASPRRTSGRSTARSAACASFAAEAPGSDARLRLRLRRMRSVRFEVIHGVHAEGPTSCPLCGEGPVRKAVTAAAVHYRGSGWAEEGGAGPPRSGRLRRTPPGRRHRVRRRERGRRGHGCARRRR